jgi:hypothetical protein
MTKWRNWQTRDAQSVVPLRHGSSTLPVVTEELQARQVPNWLRAPTEGWSGRSAWFDTGACNCAWASAQSGLISLDDHRAAPGGARCDPRTRPGRVRKLA